MQANGTLLRAFVQRCGGCLALAALMLQFALSFGHIHTHDLFGRGIPYSSSDITSGWHGPAKLEASTQPPWKLADDDNHCPICFSTFLLATSFVPAAPQPPLLLQFAAFDRLIALAFDRLAQSRRGPFQSRAPPLAG